MIRLQDAISFCRIFKTKGRCCEMKMALKFKDGLVSVQEMGSVEEHQGFFSLLQENKEKNNPIRITNDNEASE